MLHISDNSKFSVGQVWAYHTRLQDSTSTLVVVKTEADDVLGEIVHISLRDVRMRNAYQATVSLGMAHLPISEEALSRSVTRVLEENAALPEYEDGYHQWREAFDAGQAGIWTVPVAEIVDATESVVNRN